MDFKQTEQTRRLVEVTALLALSLGEQNAKVKKALEAYAFPEEIEYGSLQHRLMVEE